MEFEIVTFVLKGSANLTILPDQQQRIQVETRSVDLRFVFNLKLNTIHLTEIIRIV